MPPENYELLLDLVKRRYDDELGRAKDLDSKAGNLIGYVTIITGLIVGLGTFSILDKLVAPQYYIPYFTGIAALLISIVVSLFAIKVTTWNSSPGFKDLDKYRVNDQWFPDSKSIALAVIPDMWDAAIANYNINQSKAGKISISWIFLVIGIASLILYAAIFALTSTGNNNQLVKVLVGDAIEALQNNRPKEGLAHLMLADQQVAAIGGNSTLKLFLEDAIREIKNNQKTEALTGLKMIPSSPSGPILSTNNTSELSNNKTPVYWTKNPIDTRSHSNNKTTMIP